MTICFVFKSGYSFKTKCEEFSLKRNGFDMITGYTIKGITENKPIELNFEDIVCIYRVLSDEESDNEND